MQNIIFIYQIISDLTSCDPWFCLLCILSPLVVNWIFCIHYNNDHFNLFYFIVNDKNKTLALLWRICRYESAGPKRRAHLRTCSDFIILLFSHYGGGPCFFAAPHQHCWGAAPTSPSSVRSKRSASVASRSLTPSEAGWFRRPSAFGRRRRKAFGCNWRKDKPWTATLKKSSPLCGSQLKSR